jgi:transposase
LFGEDATTMMRRVRRFEHRGFAGLRDGERLGRPTALDARQGMRLARDLRRFGHAQHLWDGTLLAELLGQRIDRCQVAHFYFHSVLTINIVTRRS